MTCDHRELVEAYTLGILSPEEVAAFRAHLPGCTECGQAVDELSAVIHTFPEALAAVSPYRPPVSLKSRLIARLAATPPSAGTTLNGLPRVPQVPTLPHPVAVLRGRVRLLAGLGFAALLALSLALVVQLQSALAQERALRAEYASLVSQQEVVLEVIDSPRAVRRFLRAATPGSTAYGKLFTRSDMAHVVAMAARLPQPDMGQAYHLWLTRNGQTELAGIFEVNAQGFGILVFDAPVAGPVYDTAHVTLQPLGSTAPSSPTVLTWQAQ